MTGTAFQTELAPPAAGSYSQAVRCGNLVFLSGQTPRDASGVRHGDWPFEDQVKLTLDNLEAVARAAGLSLRDAVKVTVFLRDPRFAQRFDAVYATYVGVPAPARTLAQSNLDGFDVEVDAILGD